MPRVLRKYEHVDFTNLLNELNSCQEDLAIAPAETVPSKPVAPVMEVSPERRRRDSLLSNRKMRYVYSSKDYILHDRDCPHVAQIRDEDFHMLQDYALSMEPCRECRRRALLRAAIPNDDAKHIAAYLNIFNSFGATTEDIHALVIAHKAQIHDVTLDSVQIKVRDDNWIMRLDQRKIHLYHNNYEVLENYERLFRPQFHLQQTSGGPTAYRHLINTILNYSWPAHVNRLIAQEQERQRNLLRARLATVCNIVRRKRFSLLYKYYTVIDCNKKAKEYCKKQEVRLTVISGDKAGDTYRTLVCRVRRWEDKRFHVAMDRLKEYSVISDHRDYADQCVEQLKAA